MADRSFMSIPFVCECGDHAFVPMTKWGVTLVDPDNINLLRRRWVVFEGARMRHAYAIDKNHTSLHKIVLPGKKIVDHRNRNGLDNRRGNLRHCLHVENMQNRRPPNRPKTSRYKGVWTRGGRWFAEIGYSGLRVKLGSFESEEEAARQYDKAAKKYHGEFACTNETLKLYDTASP